MRLRIAGLIVALLWLCSAAAAQTPIQSQPQNSIAVTAGSSPLGTLMCPAPTSGFRAHLMCFEISEDSIPAGASQIAIPITLHNIVNGQGIVDLPLLLTFVQTQNGIQPPSPYCGPPYGGWVALNASTSITADFNATNATVNLHIIPECSNF